MVPMPAFGISSVLREAAEHRINEFTQTKQSFQHRYARDGRHSAEPNQIERMVQLIKDIKELNPELERDEDDWKLTTILHLLEQAKDDRCISESRLLRVEEDLWNLLKKHMNRMHVSDLHIDLMQEVMNANSGTDSAIAAFQKTTMDDDYEVVEEDLEDLLARFEKDASSKKEVDVEDIEVYLAGLFVTAQDQECLKTLRSTMTSYGEELWEDNSDIEQDGLMWIIMDLLRNDLVSPGKKKTLEGYLQSPIALREIAATLNMKTFSRWSHMNSHKGLQVSVRQDAAGQHCMTVEEEIIDMLFLHCTAIGWASKLKECLSRFGRFSSVFKRRFPTIEEQTKWECYLTHRHCRTCYPYGVPPPPPDVHKRSVQLLRKGKTTRLRHDNMRLPSPPRTAMRAPPPIPSFCAEDERSNQYLDEFFMSRLPSHNGNIPKAMDPSDVQANVIKTLAVETKLRKAFSNEAQLSKIQFKSLASSLPHKTIITVLKFLGVPETFLGFFTRFLEVELNIGFATSGSSERVLKRSCGLSVGHGLEMFFSEAILFFLELVIYQKTGSYLYRLYDTCYFVGSSVQSQSVTDEASRFAEVMGLELHSGNNNGNASIGFLKMNNEDSIFEIDNSKVITYAHRVKQILGASTTTLEWVRLWNSTAGKYAAHLFGPLAHVFGNGHLEAVKSAYKDMLSIVLDGKDLTVHVKGVLERHIRRVIIDPPPALEALIYLPQAYGGLGVRNPFFAFNIAHSMLPGPSTVIQKYLDDEDTYYTEAAANWAAMTTEQREHQLAPVLGDSIEQNKLSTAEKCMLLEFPTKTAITARRGTVQYPILAFNGPYKITAYPSLQQLYLSLKSEPVNCVEAGLKVRRDISDLSGAGEKVSWRELSAEDQWVLQMYSGDCFKHYGTLNIWWEEGVPTNVYKALRGCVWDDGDGDDDDDDDTASNTSSTY